MNKGNGYLTLRQLHLPLHFLLAAVTPCISQIFDGQVTTRQTSDTKIKESMAGAELLKDGCILMTTALYVADGLKTMMAGIILMLERYCFWLVYYAKW